ncbi:prenyltransferase [Candidatus Saccharibacteria bacterium]|nr:MAG: prenyltransferase [Candidatus Saccharibacteria bacterium]
MNFLTTLQKLFLVSRPISWPNTAYPFAAGYLMSGGALDFTFWIGTLFFLAPYNLLMYGVNDVFDYESDIKNPRKGGIEGMREQRAFHPTILIGSTLTTIPFAAYLLWQGSLLSKVTLLLLLFFVLAYSIRYLRFKERPFLDSATSSIHFVGPLIYALTLIGSAPHTWPYIIAFFLWGMASHAFGAVQDIIPDRHAHISSIATFLGARYTVWLCIALYVVASLLVIFQGFPALLVGITGLSYAVNLLPFTSITDQSSAQTNRGWKRFLVLNYLYGCVVTIVLLLSVHETNLLGIF